MICTVLSMSQHLIHPPASCHCIDALEAHPYLLVILMQISASQGKGGGPGQVVYQCTPLPDDAEEQYNMTGMALSLNNPHPGLLRELPPTDSRLRPDQRELELGHTEEATSEKLRLEEKQRETRRIRKV